MRVNLTGRRLDLPSTAFHRQCGPRPKVFVSPGQSGGLDPISSNDGHCSSSRIAVCVKKFEQYRYLPIFKRYFTIGPKPELSDLDSGLWAPSVEVSRRVLSSWRRGRLLVCEGLVSMTSSNSEIPFSRENEKERGGHTYLWHVSAWWWLFLSP